MLPAGQPEVSTTPCVGMQRVVLLCPLQLAGPSPSKLSSKAGGSLRSRAVELLGRGNRDAAADTRQADTGDHEGRSRKQRALELLGRGNREAAVDIRQAGAGEDEAKRAQAEDA